MPFFQNIKGNSMFKFKDKKVNSFKQKDLRTVCRLCLSGGNSLREIIDTKIPAMIQYCLNIKVLPQDDPPTHICGKCFKQILNFYSFKRKTEKNELILQSIARHRLKTDIKTNINPLNINKVTKDLAKDSAIQCSSNSNPTTKLKRIMNETELDTPQPVIYERTYEAVIRPNNCIINDSYQKQQNSIHPNVNIEPPPLVPLHTISATKKISKNLLENSHFKTPKSKYLETTILPPPPLVPIGTSQVNSEVNSENIENTCTVPSTVPKGMFTCNVCKRDLESLALLAKHKLTCTDHKNDCNICKKGFTDKKMLILHLKGHKATKEYLCNICGKKYSSPSTFRIHCRGHTGERPFKCNICDKGFVRWAGVKNHMVIHEDIKPFNCETCGKQFKVVSNLYRHQRLHTGQYKFSCSFCDKSFCQSDHLVLHTRTYHTNEKPFLCCECGKGFVSLQRLKRHELVHSGQKPYPCNLCLRAYSNSIDLKNHTLKMHGKNRNRNELKKYACSMCGLRFRHPCRLTKHIKTHMDTNKNCETCGQRFKSVQSLNRHLKTSDCRESILRAQLKENIGN